jgi:hypothetical protein
MKHLLFNATLVAAVSLAACTVTPRDHVGATDAVGTAASEAAVRTPGDPRYIPGTGGVTRPVVRGS